MIEPRKPFHLNIDSNGLVSLRDAGAVPLALFHRMSDAEYILDCTRRIEELEARVEELEAQTDEQTYTIENLRDQ